ncbi:MAG: hypothetical protein AB1Z66_00805 [Candidatus Limnocylindrales bacterium]
MTRHRMQWAGRPITTVLALLLALAGATVAQEDGPPPPEEWATASVPFAVVPYEPADQALTVLVEHHDCGKRLAQSPPSASVSVTEGTQEIGVRVDVRVDPDGRLCRQDALLRLPATLSGPVGTRTIVDASRFVPAPVNRVDPPDLGLAYACDFGAGRPFTHRELLGPGVDVRGRGITSTMDLTRALVDEGDLVILRGPFDGRGRVGIEHWRLRGDTWKRQRSRCLLMATSPPNLGTASWKLGGVKPDRTSKNLDVKVQEWACASGRPPVGRVVPPQQWYRRDAAYLLFHTFPISASWEANERIGERASIVSGTTAFVDCQGAPPAPYRVKLQRKLKDRTLYDAAWFPPQAVKEPK